MDQDRKKEILKALVLSEEDTLKKFEELIKKSRKLFAIDGKNGRVIFESYSFTNPEKIVLFLIGEYFAKELDLVDSYKFTSRQLSDSLGIKTTTISKPLGILLSGYVAKEDDMYFINHFKIEEILDSLINKYREPKETTKEGLSLDYVKTGTKKITGKGGKSSGKNKAKKTSGARKVSSMVDTTKISFTENPHGIKSLIKDLETTEDKIESIFEFKDDVIHLLKKKHCNQDSDENFYNAIIYLTGYYYHFDEREISGRLLHKFLKDAKISVGTHFKRDMDRKDRRGYLICKKKSYKITNDGIKLGLKLIKEMI